MRIAFIVVLATLSFVGAWAAAGEAASATTAPTLRVASGRSLVLVGTGFEPRSLVRLRVTGPGVDRRASVKVGARGSFTTRFAGVDPCSVTEATASGANGARARVPTPWFVRECPPPPPLAPGVYSAD